MTFNAFVLAEISNDIKRKREEKNRQVSLCCNSIDEIINFGTFHQIVTILAIN